MKAWSRPGPGAAALGSPSAPALSVLIVNYNSWRVCVEALESLAAHPPRRRDGSPMPFEVVVVDNNSPRPDAEAQARVRALLDDLRGNLILHGENGGYAKGMNLAYAHARGRWILVSNPDVVFQPGCLDGLLRYLEDHADAGAVAPAGYWDRGLECRLPPNILPTLGDLFATTLAGVSRRGARRYSARRAPDALRAWLAEAAVDLRMLSGCCFLIDRALIDAIGLFDERFPLYFEDTDLSQRIRRAGKRIVHVPQARLVHLYNRSAETDHEAAMARYWISRRAYYRKWYGPLGGWLHDLSRRLLSTKWARDRAARSPHAHVHVLPSSAARPVLRFPRRLERFLVEISLDERFYLAAGVIGAGESWSPADPLFRNFGPTTFFFRVCDLSRGTPEEVGVYRYTRLAATTALAPAVKGGPLP